MSEARYTKNGLLIPKNWLKNMGEEIRVQRGKGILIIESKPREAARKQLVRMVKKLRLASQELGIIRQDEIDTLVGEVRKVRASHR